VAKSKLAAADVTILPSVATLEHFNRFGSPYCAIWIVKDASPRIVTLLLRAGARVATWDDEPGEPPNPLGPITDAVFAAFDEKLNCSPQPIAGSRYCVVAITRRVLDNAPVRV
jgi:hypothetical protein